MSGSRCRGIEDSGDIDQMSRGKGEKDHRCSERFCPWRYRAAQRTEHYLLLRRQNRYDDLCEVRGTEGEHQSKFRGMYDAEERPPVGTDL